MKISNHSSRRKSLEAALFYTGLFLAIVMKMLEKSALINLPDIFFTVIMFISMALFFMKIVLGNHKRYELILGISIIVTAIIARGLTGDLTFLLLTALAFVSIRGTDIKTVIKIDLIVKMFFLALNTTLFMVDFLTGSGIAQQYIFESEKGLSISLYFTNPNTTGLVGLSIALDLLFLKDDKKVRVFIVPTLIMIATFLVTASRTPLWVYILYLLLQFIKDGEKLTVMQKITYPLLCMLTLFVLMFVKPGDFFYDTFNHLLSGRIRWSLMAYNTAGINVLPSASSIALLKEYTLDVFYVKCFVEYGLITMIIYYLPHLLLPKKASNEAKRMSIISSFYLLFESVAANVGFTVMYLIIADSIYNRKEDEDE